MSDENRGIEEARTLLGLAGGRRLYAGWLLLALAVLSSVVALWLFAQPTQSGAAWTLQIAGLVLFAAGIPLVFRGPGPTAEPLEPLNWLVVIYGLIILGLAIFLRYFRLDSLPFGTWYDEAELGLRAMQIMSDSAFRPAVLPDLTIAYYFPALTALSFKLFGVGTLSIRMVTAFFGVGSVAVAFFLGREIYGNRFGLLLAFFLAVARWAITLDRLSMPISSTGPFFILLALWLLFAGRRTSSTRYFAWAGLVAGLGLGFHNSLRLFPLVILVFLAYWTAGQVRAHSGDRGWRIAWGVNLAALVVGGVLASGIIIQDAVRHPDSFWNRTRQVSIFEKRDEPNVVRALGSNTLKNALMFNYQGDRNPRHNLPGEPMLDPVTGALFVLGFILALSRFRKPAEMLFIVTFVVGLSVAILTVDFEAPQAQRGVGAMAAVFFFAALSAEAYWRVLDRSTSPVWARPLGIVLSLAAGAAIVYANTNGYFVRQANDNAVWQSHNAVQTVTAKKLRELGPDGPTSYVSMFLHDHPVIRFLAPGANTIRLEGPDVVPLREPGDRPVVVLVDLEQDWIAEAVEAFYPNAETTVTTSPGGTPMHYTVVVPADDIRRVQGLEASYWPGDEVEGQPEIRRIESELYARWPADAPLNAPFVAEWRGVLYAPEFGQYTLALQSPGAATLRLDGEPLLVAEQSGEQSSTLNLAQGNHALNIQAEGAEGLMRLAWIRPGSDPAETIPAWALYYAPMVASRGLLASFYEGGDWNAQPALQRIDPFVDAYFHLIPLNRPYGAIWSGQIEAPQDGTYAFGMEANGQAELYINDTLVLEAAGPPAYREATIDLEAGRHDFRVQFLDDVGGSRLHLFWTPPGQERQIIPANVLTPARHSGEG